MAAVEARDAVLSYTSEPQLRIDSLTLDMGVYACFTGRSGSGKTLLAEHLALLRLPMEGCVCIDGSRPRSRREARRIRRRLIGYIPQENLVVPGATVYSNIAIGLPEGGRDTIEAVARRLGIEDLLWRRADDVSGGQLRRVVIARALVKSPKIIVADEPLAGLDDYTARKVVEILADLVKSGATVIHLEPVLDDFIPCDIMFRVGGGTVTRL